MIKINDDNLDIVVCNSDDNYISVLGTNKDGQAMYYNVKYDNVNKTVNITYYRYLKDKYSFNSINSYSTGILYFENYYKRIYVNDKLVFDNNSKVNKCN